MNQDLILAAALKVGLTFELPPTKLLEFADLVRALEREACAKVCEQTNDGTPYNLTAECAAAIRSRT